MGKGEGALRKEGKSVLGRRSRGERGERAEVGGGKSRGERG